MMWIPKDTEELEQAVRTGTVDEARNLEFKGQLVDNKKIAKIVAGLAVDGGVLIFGVHEDKKSKRPTILAPFELEGEPERVEQIIRSSIEEAPDVEITPLWKDKTTGYLMVVVPASPRAPHQVTAGGDNRFYGRSGTSTVRLEEGDVARLYERRQRSAEESRVFLDTVISSFPTDRKNMPRLFIGVRPFGNPVIEDYQISGWLPTLVTKTCEAVNDPWNRFGVRSHLPRTDGTRCDMSSSSFQKFCDVTLRGEVRLMTMRPGDRLEGRGYTLFPNVIHGNVKFAVVLAGHLFKKVGFYGNTEIAIALLGAQGAPAFLGINEFGDTHPLHTDDHRESQTASSSRLLSKSGEVVDEMTKNLFRALRVSEVRGEFGG